VTTNARSKRRGPRVSGHIATVGTGAGTSTDIQIRNATTGRDYFETEPAFEVDDAVSGKAVLSGGTLKNNPTFRQGQTLALDIDAVPGGANSAEATIWLTCGFWREVE
jgi:hypothetical protein